MQNHWEKVNEIHNYEYLGGSLYLALPAKDFVLFASCFGSDVFEGCFQEKGRSNSGWVLPYSQPSPFSVASEIDLK